MRVLVVGGGAREHALCWKIKQSPRLEKLYCAPGNPGTAEIAENVAIKSGSIGALALWAIEQKIDLTIVGPEAPLADGLVDTFAGHGLRVFGPTKAAAQLESSKSFAKEVLLKTGVKTAAAATFSDYAGAREYLEKHGAPIVIKADGLASGKGVVVAETKEQALEVLEEFMLRGKHGASGAKVLLEEKLIGQEASVMAIVDGEVVLPFVVSQDYKRLRDGDEGPNTGGMGSISPTPVLADKRAEELVGEIFLPVVRELRARGIAYRGFLYAGVMVDSAGVVRVIEFNCRLGDPETQVLLMRLKSDLLAVLDAAADSRLRSMKLEWSPESAVCVVLASGGYPEKVDDGKVIKGLSIGAPVSAGDVQIFHAGTEFGTKGSEEIQSRGGRVLSVTARNSTLEGAIERAYSRVETISFDGMQYRRDVGAAAVSGKHRISNV